MGMYKTYRGYLSIGTLTEEIRTNENEMVRLQDEVDVARRNRSVLRRLSPDWPCQVHGYYDPTFHPSTVIKATDCFLMLCMENGKYVRHLPKSEFSEKGDVTIGRSSREDRFVKAAEAIKNVEKRIERLEARIAEVTLCLETLNEQRDNSLRADQWVQYYVRRDEATPCVITAPNEDAAAKLYVRKELGERVSVYKAI